MYYGFVKVRTVIIMYACVIVIAHACIMIIIHACAIAALRVWYNMSSKYNSLHVLRIGTFRACNISCTITL